MGVQLSVFFKKTIAVSVTISISVQNRPSSFIQQNERNASRTRKSQCLDCKELPQRNLHQFIL